ncbi:MAG: histidinol phosphatase [Ferruginibacter sp.]
MFSFFKSKKQAASVSDYFPFVTDMHSHILPGIDDGAPDVETSITLIKGLMEMGVTGSIATPHIIGDLYRNDATTINAALKVLQDELKKQKINFKVSAAAEYMLDSYFFELIDAKTKFLTIKDNIILTEFSYAAMPQEPGKMSFALITEGYAPILAHPERYPYYYGNYKMYHHLADLGFMLQVNLLSLTGYYGREAQKVSQYLLKHDLVSYVGTDMHHTRHLGVLTDPKTRATFEKALSHKKWNEF